MSTEWNAKYNKVAEAILFLQQNFKNQPSLDEVAEKVQLSPYHFQRLFTDWAGVSPKKFLQYISVNYAKNLLKDKQTSLFNTALETGLSGTGRLHDLFVKIEGMTPGEFKQGGKNLQINYSFSVSPFGEILAASTYKGLCYMAFIENKEQSLNELKSNFPNANFHENFDKIQENAVEFYSYDWSKINEIKLHLKGTEFQLKVWESLLKIPFGNLTTYGALANRLDNPRASRAVGTAIGKNPVAFIIPCHRVIQSSGIIGGYMWGAPRKAALIGWEAAKVNS